MCCFSLVCTRSIALAAEPGHLPNLSLLALFSMGAVVRGIGSATEPAPYAKLHVRLDMTVFRVACAHNVCFVFAHFRVSSYVKGQHMTSFAESLQGCVHVAHCAALLRHAQC